jgi:uncharacterized phage protein (TIGR01671 family)
MREIKFRVYDEEVKKIYEVETWDELQMPNVMQYTGLLDKNNKEIYEGDIVEIQKGDNCEKFEVLYQGSCFSIKIIGNIDLPIVRIDRAIEYIKIIGNIYENPELLSLKEN